MHNKAKSEQNLAVANAKRGAVFQASLKVGREEAGSQLSNKDNIRSTSQGSNCSHEGETVSENDKLILR